MRTHASFFFFFLATSSVIAQSTTPYTLPVDLVKVRVHPTSAQMETIAYDPVSLQVTSKTDVKGITSYYFYDDLGRLKTVSDGKRNITQSFKYNYRHT